MRNRLSMTQHILRLYLASTELYPKSPSESFHLVPETSFRPIEKELLDLLHRIARVLDTVPDRAIIRVKLIIISTLLRLNKQTSTSNIRCYTFLSFERTNIPCRRKSVSRRIPRLGHDARSTSCPILARSAKWLLQPRRDLPSGKTSKLIWPPIE